MILLRANAGLKVVFVKLINTMGRNFTWNDIFIIRNNNLVLAGSDSVMIFDFGNKAVGSNTAEVNLKEDSIVQITKNEMLENVLNMTLYAFGKWGKIKGLTVERDYPQINALFSNILREIEVEPLLSADNLRLYRSGVQITYEDMIQLILDQQEKQEQIKAEQAVEQVPEEAAHGKGKYDIGLWHKIVWKSENDIFDKEELTDEEKRKTRIGNNFYKVNSKCPICKEKLSMVIYPEGEELLIETDEKGVYLARAYTCHVCHRLFTPKPNLLLTDGSVYTLDFEEDSEAYEDYIEIIGKSGVRTYNCNLNQYEAEYKQIKSKNETQLEEICADIDSLSDQEVSNLDEKMDMGFFPPNSVERCRRIVVKEIKKRKQHAETVKEREEKNKIRNEHREETAEETVAVRNIVQGVKEKRNAMSDEEKDNLFTLSRYHEEEIGADKNVAPKQGSGHLRSIGDGKDKQTDKKDQKKIGKRFQYEYTGEKTSGNTGEKTSGNTREKTSGYTDEDEENLTQIGSSFSELEQSDEEKKIMSSKLGNPYIGDTESDKIYLAPYIDPENNLREKAEACKGKDYRTIQRVMEDIRREDVSDEIRESLLAPLQKLLEARGRKELTSLRQEIPEHFSKKQYLLFKDRIAQYTAIDHDEDMEYLELRREEAVKQEIAALIKKANAKDRSSYMRLYQDLKKEGFEDNHIAPYLENIHDKIYTLDEASIKRICGDPAELTYERGLKAYEEITKRDLLPELKTNTLGLIEKRLTKIKMNECEQLVGKLTKDLSKYTSNSERVHYYNVRAGIRCGTEEENTVIRNALNSYASGRGKYEFPILICDASVKADGKRGFVLTPDHIFYNTITESGTIDVMQVGKIITRRGRKIYADTESSGKIKLSNSLKLSDVQGFSKILDEFVSYLKEKPESRDIAYIAKEKHSVKCCYRCGHVYKGDNICPKCGAKFNE